LAADTCTALHRAEVTAWIAAALFAIGTQFLPRVGYGWVIGRDAVAMLESVTESRAHTWLAQGMPQLTRWRSQLASSLELLGLTVRESPATFLLVRVGDATRITAHLRSQNDVRVRDGTSFGLRHWIRLSAQPPAAQKAPLAALKSAL
jgi:histidinol-phosphate aminotransferase